MSSYAIVLDLDHFENADHVKKEQTALTTINAKYLEKNIFDLIQIFLIIFKP